MARKIILASIILLLSISLAAQDRALTAGMKLTKTTRIKKAVYRLDAPAKENHAVILVEGNNITIDFNHSSLKGSLKAINPDEYKGVALLVRNSRNVTIKNFKASGYKVALHAITVEGLTIENCDFSYNYRPHLNSTQEKEDVSDWMSYHHNEKDEWLRYGAAIYLKNCNDFIITNTRVTGGQNALMLSHSNNGQVYNNDFSFNSGIGIGLYRSSRNRIMHNRVMFNVRGYSHGVYNRGQDSAGILVYEQSSENLFFKNNVTHGGDGFFLWAGQTTMDNGTGGCNDNFLVGNDFSYAPTNGIEVTFSRNRIEGNRIFECDHGIWGGYSYGTLIMRNQFRNNRIAIAIEHGQDNKIFNNVFIRDKEAIRLWAREKQPADWGYAQKRDTRSKGYAIVANSFNDNSIVYNLNRTDSIYLFNNAYSSSIETIFKTDSTVTAIDSVFQPYWDDYFTDLPPLKIPEIKNPSDPFKGMGIYNGRKNIRMTEWGPYDFRSPILWNTNPVDKGDTMHFEIEGPKGNWVMKQLRGVTLLSSNKGKVPGTLTALKKNSGTTDIFIELEYSGEKIITPLGKEIAKGKPYRFHFSKFFQPLDWEVLFYSMDTAYFNPLREEGLFSPTVKMAPFKTEHVNKLDYAWWGGIKTDQTYRQFITIASTTTDIPPGNYELAVTWDDAVRIYLDEKLILDEWNPSKYSFDESPHKKVPLKITGKHYLRVEHLELGGFATLAVRVRRFE
jgi:parallel beta-helix repeat protein